MIEFRNLESVVRWIKARINDSESMPRTYDMTYTEPFVFQCLPCSVECL